MVQLTQGALPRQVQYVVQLSDWDSRGEEVRSEVFS